MSNSHDLPERRDRGSGSYGVAVVMGLFVVVSIIALPFMPLLMALCEGALFKTRHVEAFFERIGLHDELGDLYQTVFGWFF